MALILARTEIRPIGDGRWQEVECYEDRLINSFTIIRTEEKIVTYLRPVAPEESHDALRDAGKRVILARADPDIWVTEE